MKLIIDRLEGNYAVCELESTDEPFQRILNIPIELLPNAEEGDMIEVEFGECGNSVALKLDKVYKKSKLSQLEDKYGHLWE